MDVQIGVRHSDALGYVPIDNLEECEAAASILGFSDTVATERASIYKVAGCYVLPNGALEFNSRWYR